jgi:hypothetical protein
VLYSKLQLLLNRSLLGKKRWNCRCCQEGIPHEHVDLPLPVSVEAQGSAYLLVTEKFCLQLFINPQGATGVMEWVITELLSFRNECTLAGDLNAKHRFWNSAVSNPSGEKLSRHSVRLITPTREMEKCWILWSIRISGFHMSLSLIFWTQITYQQHSKSWITLELQNSRNHSKNSQIRYGFKA